MDTVHQTARHTALTAGALEEIVLLRWNLGGTPSKPLGANLGQGLVVRLFTSREQGQPIVDIFALVQNQSPKNEVAAVKTHLIGFASVTQNVLR